MEFVWRRSWLLAALMPLLLAGCGHHDPQAPATVSSASYSCTHAALAQLPGLRQAVMRAVPHAVTPPRIRNYCDRGLEAGVEFSRAGTVTTSVPAVRRALHCGRPDHRAGPTGRTAVLTCRVAGLSFRLTLAPYLSAGDPHGPTVLGEASLLRVRS